MISLEKVIKDKYFISNKHRKIWQDPARKSNMRHKKQTIHVRVICMEAIETVQARL